MMTASVFMPRGLREAKDTYMPSTRNPIPPPLHAGVVTVGELDAGFLEGEAVLLSGEFGGTRFAVFPEVDRRGRDAG